MMGINVSTANNRSTSSSGEFFDQVERNNQIEAQLKEDRKIGALTRKLLLLGAAEAGKSTVLKQLRVLHENKFNEAELTTMKLAIYNNVLLISHAIFEVMSTRNMRFENDHSELDKVVVLMAIRTKACRDSLQGDVAEALLRLKNDRTFKHCYVNFNQYLIPESSEYFFENLDRLCACDYVPNEEDAVRCRIITTGVNEIQLRIKNIILRIVDVGGQRSERRKWIHCFSDVDSLIFVTSLSEYNMVLMEDSQTNRMKESITLFEKIANCKWFSKKAIILFLNKKDVFEEKLKLFPLTIAFKDYDGPQDYETACAYIEKQFISNRKDSNAHIYTHRTCATDTKNVQVVFEACTHIIIKGQLRSAGLM